MLKAFPQNIDLHERRLLDDEDEYLQFQSENSYSVPGSGLVITQLILDVDVQLYLTSMWTPTVFF